MGILRTTYEYVRDLAHEQAAIVLDEGKEYLIECRLQQVAREAGVDSVDALVEKMRKGARELQPLVVEAMTTNETSFFRDQHPFLALRQHVFPALAEQRSGARELSIWCAASSSGQEPYSIAMTVLEHFPELASWDVSILGTDISEEMLTRCREGQYSQLEVNRGLPATLLIKYFTRDGMHWRVADRMRNIVNFRTLNLAKPWFGLPRFDIVFIRNVLIYFDLATKRQILGRLADVLRPDGYMFLGGAETTINLDSGFERVTLGKASCYRRQGQPSLVAAPT